jgi:hypothetical protein
MKNIIDIKQYKKLQKLLLGSDEDKTLALNIINQSDIQKSFLTILCLMSQYRNKVYAYGSELGKCENLVDYLFKLNKQEHNYYTVDLDLHWVMKIYKMHREVHHIPESTQDNKFILNEYQTFEHNPVFTFKAQLNPKKKI